VNDTILLNVSIPAWNEVKQIAPCIDSVTYNPVIMILILLANVYLLIRTINDIRIKNNYEQQLHIKILKQVIENKEYYFYFSLIITNLILIANIIFTTYIL